MRTSVVFAFLFATGLAGCASSPPPARAPAAASPASAEPPPSAAPAGPSAAPAPATTSAGQLTASEQALVDELLAGLMGEVKTQLENVIAALERLGGDCKKAAAALLAPELAAADLTARMTAYKAKLEGGGPMRPAVRERLRAITIAAFSPELRQRTEAIVDPLEARCRADAEFQRALQTSGYPAAPH